MTGFGLLCQLLLVVAAAFGYAALLSSLHDVTSGRRLLFSAYFFIFAVYGALLEAGIGALYRPWSGIDSLVLGPPILGGVVVLPVLAFLLWQQRSTSRPHTVAFALCCVYPVPVLIVALR